MSDQKFRACICILFPWIATSAQLIGIVIDGMLLFLWLFLECSTNKLTLTLSLSFLQKSFFVKNAQTHLQTFHVTAIYSHFDTKLFLELENNFLHAFVTLKKIEQRYWYTTRMGIKVIYNFYGQSWYHLSVIYFFKINTGMCNVDWKLMKKHHWTLKITNQNFLF